VPPIFCESAAITAVMAFRGTVPLAEKFVGRRVIGMLRRSQTPSASSAASATPANRITQIIQGKRTLVRHQRPILAQSSKCIRHSRRRARIGRRDRTPPYAFRIRQKTSTMITREKSTRTPATGAPLGPIGAEVAISRSAAQKPAPNAWQPQGARHETGQQNSQGVGIKMTARYLIKLEPDAMTRCW
jgi:hypothetical protein